MAAAAAIVAVALSDTWAAGGVAGEATAATEGEIVQAAAMQCQILTPSKMAFWDRRVNDLPPAAWVLP